MALSAKARRRLEVAMARRAEATEIADAIDNGGNPQAAAVAAIGATTDFGTTDGSGQLGDAPLAADVEARMDAVEGKIDEVIAALKAAGVMAS